MKAEETIMDKDEMLACSLISKYSFNKVRDVIKETAIHQAEISFKAGQDSVPEPWDREQTVFEDGKKAGMKLVVELIKETRNTPLGEDAYGYYVWKTRLQVFLKEQGL